MIAFVTKGGKHVTARNIQEQVLKNAQDIEDIVERAVVLADFGIKVIGNVESAEDLPDPETYEGEYGDAYTVGTEAPYEFYVYTRASVGDEYPHWFNIGYFPVPGPQGPQGEQGPKGDTGREALSCDTIESQTLPIVGRTFGAPTNLFNRTPVAYEKFTALYTRTISPYGSFMISATVVNSTRTTTSFTIDWASNDLTGPQGIQGERGPIGPQGPKGNTGAQGPAGTSGPAYEVLGHLISADLLPDAEDVGQGKGYFIGATLPYDLYVTIGEEGTREWLNIGNVVNVPVEAYITLTTSTGTLTEAQITLLQQDYLNYIVSTAIEGTSLILRLRKNDGEYLYYDSSVDGGYELKVNLTDYSYTMEEIEIGGTGVKSYLASELSTNLTSAQANDFMNNIILVKGYYLGLTNPIFSPASLDGNWAFGVVTGIVGQFIILTYTIKTENNNAILLNSNIVDANIKMERSIAGTQIHNLKYLNQKSFPSYPSSPPKPKFLTYGTNNNLSWSDAPDASITNSTDIVNGTGEDAGKLLLHQDIKDAISGNNEVEITITDDDWGGLYYSKNIQLNNTFFNVKFTGTHTRKGIRLYCPFFKGIIKRTLPQSTVYRFYGWLSQSSDRHVGFTIPEGNTYKAFSIFNGVLTEIEIADTGTPDPE